MSPAEFARRQLTRKHDETRIVEQFIELGSESGTAARAKRRALLDEYSSAHGKLPDWLEDFQQAWKTNGGRAFLLELRAQLKSDRLKLERVLVSETGRAA